MKKITLQEYRNQLARNDWHREQETEQISRSKRKLLQWNNINAISPDRINEIINVNAILSITSRLDGIIIKKTEQCEYYENYPDPMSITMVEQRTLWEFTGIEVTNNNNIITKHNLIKYLPAEFSAIDYGVLLPTRQQKQKQKQKTDGKYQIHETSTNALQFDNQKKHTIKTEQNQHSQPK